MTGFEPKDQTVWVVIGDFGTATFYVTEEFARDQIRRKDKLYTARLTDWEEI